MFRYLLSLGVILALSACQSRSTETHQSSLDDFEQRLVELQSRYQIPGLSVHIRRDGTELLTRGYGFADAEAGEAVSSLTEFPVASLTKLYSATLVLKAVEEGRLSLDEPVARFVPNLSIDDRITVGQVLSHTSQGSEPGKRFYYSSRFSLLTQVIEKTYAAPFEQVLRDELLVPLGLNSAYLLPPSEAGIEPSRLARLARPYQFEGERIPGFVDYGASASAGLVTTMQEVGVFVETLFGGEALAATALARLTQPPAPGLPYRHGIFVDELYGKTVYWAYGQYDSYSSLMVIVPESGLTLAMSANNAHLADPARLIYGNLRNSEFALAFLATVVGVDANGQTFRRDALKAAALADSFFGRFDPALASSSETRLAELIEAYPDVTSYGDLALLHNMSMLKLIAHHVRGESFTRFDAGYRKIAEALIVDDPENPYARIYLAELFDLNGSPGQAKIHYQAIVDARNFSQWWYTTQARQWLLDEQP